ncbi:MAG: mechanosensitive ion channel [Methanobrevibacter sp.]|nr:mechanosensitive ion channel [Methanobrevibacter sp.]
MDLSIIITPLSLIVEAIIIIIVAYVIVKAINFFLNRMATYDKNVTVIYASKDLIAFIIYVIAIILLFSLFGIDLKGILVSIGIIGMGISFAAKDFIADFMSGFYIIAYKTLEIGDIMQINNSKGQITKIGLRNITLLTDLEDTIIIPNATLSKTPYIRYKKQELEKVKVKTQLPFKINIDEFKKNIVEIINSYDEILKTPKATIESIEIGEIGPIINVVFWVETFNKKEEYKLIITNQIRKLINEKLGDEN